MQALLPLNFAAPGQAADYVVTGHWGKTAIKQVRPYVDVHVAADGELHLVAKRGRARCGGGEPRLGRHSCGEGVLDGRLLAHELLVVRHGQVRARAARTDVEIVAVHALSGGR